MDMNENNLTWPVRTNCQLITLSSYKESSDSIPSSVISLDTEDKISLFFSELEKLNPEAKGEMINFAPTVSHISIHIKYDDVTAEELSIYAGHLKTCDTSFYSQEEDLLKEKVFIVYLESLFS
jgi:hypothetical protein